MIISTNIEEHRQFQIGQSLGKYGHMIKQILIALRCSVTFFDCRGHGGRVVTLLPRTSEAGVRFPARPQVGKLVVACRWSAVYSTEP